MLCRPTHVGWIFQKDTHTSKNSYKSSLPFHPLFFSLISLPSLYPSILLSARSSILPWTTAVSSHSPGCLGCHPSSTKPTRGHQSTLTSGLYLTTTEATTMEIGKFKAVEQTEIAPFTSHFSLNSHLSAPSKQTNIEEISQIINMGFLLQIDSR